MSTGGIHHFLRPGSAGQGVVHGICHLLEPIDPQVRVCAGRGKHPPPFARLLQLRLHVLPGQTAPTGIIGDVLLNSYVCGRDHSIADMMCYAG